MCEFESLSKDQVPLPMYVSWEPNELIRMQDFNGEGEK